MNYAELLKELEGNLKVPVTLFDLSARTNIPYWELKRMCEKLQKNGLVKLYHNEVLITEMGIEAC